MQLGGSPSLPDGDDQFAEPTMGLDRHLDPLGNLGDRGTVAINPDGRPRPCERAGVLPRLTTGAGSSRCRPSDVSDADVELMPRVGVDALRDPSGRHRSESTVQHSTTLTASPPRDVSLYLSSMSRPVSRIVLMT